MSSSLISSGEVLGTNGFSRYPSIDNSGVQPVSPTLPQTPKISSFVTRTQSVVANTPRLQPLNTNKAVVDQTPRLYTATPNVKTNNPPSPKVHVQNVVEPSEDVESVLLSLGFKSVERVALKSTTSQLIIRYSKCIDIHNNVCMIEHDGYGQVSDISEEHMYEEQSCDNVVGSLRNQVCEMSKRHGCMLCIATKQGYYVVDNVVDVKKEVYLVKKNKLQHASLDIHIEDITIIPVFRFTDIEKHKTKIFHKITDMKLHILCVMNRLAEEKNKEFDHVMKEVANKWTEYGSKRDEYVRKLHDRLYKIECLIKELEKKPGCDVQKLKQLRIKYNELLKDYEQLNTILLSSFKLVEHAKDICHILDDNISKIGLLC